MAFESVRSYVQLASGLGELTRAKAMDAAQGLLSLPGLDEVTKRAVQASALADQLLEGARANQASLVALVQQEVEAAMRRADVARVADLDAARQALATMSRELADLRDTVVTTGAAAVGGAASRASRTGGQGSATGVVSTLTGGSDAGAGAGPALTSSAVTTRATRGGSTAKKSTAKKSTAKKSTAKRSTAKKSAAQKSTAKKSTAKKSTAKKATSGRSTAQKSTAQKSTAKRSTAKRSTAKKEGSS